ncbi:hypothetical protein H6G20_06225 [Desertifilum sp. FACHB-1129]|uniref:hypothetical protein n=1 Tax=unclassified Desertifilum TaxID=2621682 RepID=UPI0016882EB9|nr:MULTISPECIES: hypothetical protein [unclassified Desertifilum]MBD2311254.1 hypothetical protein [Desertifilum sp. FACHB-1129]MBD2324300.1 hypothetical protein [Desertifilum sp. FACHB-866]MBD2334315.1 hypothetical protein [Desertifilum sp. FACHB-868]MDA0213161.1 hypothetical protein [Cyanobacteria bacterium FC1]
MSLVTIKQLRPSTSYTRSSHLSNLQQNLNLYLRQVQIGLDPSSLLTSEPQLAEAIAQLNSVMPTVLQPNHPIQLGVDLTAPLTLPDSTTVYLQATVNLGMRRGVPKIFDWTFRHPRFNWTDATRLWVVTQFYRRQNIAASQIKLVVIALHLTRPPLPVVFDWSAPMQQRTQKWLIQRLQPQSNSPQFNSSQNTVNVDFESIPEVVL